MTILSYGAHRAEPLEKSTWSVRSSWIVPRGASTKLSESTLHARSDRSAARRPSASSSEGNVTSKWGVTRVLHSPFGGGSCADAGIPPPISTSAVAMSAGRRRAAALSIVTGRITVFL